MPIILHIEDDEFIARIVRNLLEREGFKVLHAYAAQEGLDLAYQYKPELVLMDMWLPSGLDGWEATQVIKNDERLVGTYVVALTAQGSLAAQQRAYEVGCDAYLAKPFEMHQLIECVRKLLG